jgi:hypothetical protein
MSMGVSISFNVVISERELRSLREYGIDLGEICKAAIVAEVLRRQEIDAVLMNLQPERENQKLRNRLEELKAKLARARETPPVCVTQ